MSMLAEPRRKQKWSVDPRNSAWTKDESKFGQKMLERMGWSKGKGLGKSEQGATEHIKVKVKNNNLGLGTAGSNEDNWIAHQDDFNQLLADLNNCHGQNGNKEATEEENHGFSLEEKSKMSRKRVHYMKFTKGKDLSSRSQTDLACIFGKRTKQARDQEEECSADSPEEKEPEAAEVEPNTVTSTLTMQEYFAQRMSQLKKSRKGTSCPTEVSNSIQSQSTGNTENADGTENMMTKKKKKKKRARQEAEEEIEECVELSSVGTSENVDVEQSCFERKKKKKKKQSEKEKEDNEDLTASTGVEETCDNPAEATMDGHSSSQSGKGKKKRRKRQEPKDH
ncbi:PIN2/TERF1-interacting telomerase inhibitor 1 [Denticeps clupeoides]|uniref:G-patch domain-containing protein n=1 Tax=Denticeps clupeoides TaxID=299321 RepID=A0AAY4AZA9_9TELE|nr:PIN2/TERF1-interacting telomerase inhibitor 1 [Denticeps clupeoides]